MLIFFTFLQLRFFWKRTIYLGILCASLRICVFAGDIMRRKTSFLKWSLRLYSNCDLMILIIYANTLLLMARGEKNYISSSHIIFLRKYKLPEIIWKTSHINKNRRSLFFALYSNICMQIRATPTFEFYAPLFSCLCFPNIRAFQNHFLSPPVHFWWLHFSSSEMKNSVDVFVENSKGWLLIVHIFELS